MVFAPGNDQDIQKKKNKFLPSPESEGFILGVEQSSTDPLSSDKITYEIMVIVSVAQATELPKARRTYLNSSKKREVYGHNCPEG